MAKNYKFFILIGLLGLVSIALILNLKECYKQEECDPNVICETPYKDAEEAITVLLKDGRKSYVLMRDDVEVIVSKTLQPLFVIKQNQRIDNLRIYFDDSMENLLNIKFSNAVVEYDGDLKISFKYTLEPQKHRIVIKYNKNNQEVVEEYNFLLVLFDDFSQPLSQSRLWGLADSAKLYNNWEIKEGHLVANPLPIDANSDAISSLFFVRRFQGDFFVQFDFIPKSDTIAFLPYLLQRQLNFVFGDTGNKDVMILGKPETRANLTFEPQKIYHVRLIRDKDIYKVFVTTSTDFSDKDLLITYVDKEQLKVPFDAFGFTIWQNSDGVEIDNFYTANEDISSFLDAL